MAFAFAMKSKEVVVGGYVVERGTWTGTGATTTGNITVDTATQPEIIKIETADISSDTDLDVQKAYDVNDTTVKLTFTALDTGTYCIKGKCA